MHGGAGRGARLEGHRLALGEREHAVLAEPTGELGPPAARAVFARRDERYGARVLRDERGPRECSRTRGRVRDGETLTILQSRRQLAVRDASVSELEDSTEASARDLDGANH